MAENANLLSTPEGYATPDQIKSTYEYAKALMSGSGQQPIHHWTQGVSNMVSALVGGNLDYGANRQQNEANAVRAGRMLPTLPGSTPPGGTPTSFNDSPSSAGSTSAGGDASQAISGIESGGNYQSVGNVTRTGDRAYGKYQVMGENIPQWTSEALGKPMNIADFLHNPDAQEAVFKHKFGEYQQKYGPEGAAKAWFAGERGMKNANASDVNGMTVDRYGKKFMTAFAGPDAQNQNPAVSAISSALRGGTQVADGTQVAAGRPAAPSAGQKNPMPQPNASGIYVDPALVQRRPRYNEGQMRGILSDPTITEQAKLGLLQQYNQQDAPIDVPYAGGVVRINPNNPRQQQFIPELQKGEKKLGDMTVPQFGTIQPQPGGGGGVQFNPAQTVAPPPGPRSEATPPAAPAAAPAPVTAGGPALALNASAAPATAPNAPVQVASLEPGAGVTQAAEKSGEAPKSGAGYDHFNPATGAVEKVSDKPTEVAQASTPLGKLAQAAPPGGLSLHGFSPQDTEDYARMQQFKIKNAVDEEAQKKGVEFATKKYDTLSTQAQAARRQIPNLDYALALMNDKNFYSGLMSNEVLTWNKFKAALPSFFGDEAKAAAAPNEVFNKVISGSILDNMKTALGGLGQVRIAEIDLLKQANASNVNTPAANRALLTLARKSNMTMDHLDEMGQAYYSGAEVVDPVSGKTLLAANQDRNGETQMRHGLDVGFDKLARKFMLEHPSLTPEEIKNYQEIFKTGIDPNAPAQAPAAVPGQSGNSAPIAPGGNYTWDPNTKKFSK